MKKIVKIFLEKEKQKKLGDLLIEVNNTYGEISEDRFRKYMIDKIYNHWNISKEDAELIYEKCCFK